MEWVTLDSEEAMELMQRFEIEDIPHVIYYESGSLVHQVYMDARAPAAFVKFFNRVHEGVRYYQKPGDLETDLKGSLYADGCILGVFKTGNEKIQ